MLKEIKLILIVIVMACLLVYSFIHLHKGLRCGKEKEVDVRLKGNPTRKQAISELSLNG